MNVDKIYTHDEASRIVGFLEDVLCQYNISVPSPEDDERDEDDMIGLYGSTYSDIFDRVEYALIEMLDRHKDGVEVITDEYSGRV